MSTERMDIILKQVGQGDSSDIIRELKEQIGLLFSAAGEGGRGWVRGKGNQELAKATEIMANVHAKLGQLAIDRERMVQERDAQDAIHRRENKKEKNRHEEEMFKLETERMAAKAVALEKMVSTLNCLAELGAPVDARILERMLSSL